MKSKDRDPQNILDQTLSEMRAEKVDSGEVDRAAARVWSNLEREWHAAQTPLTHPPEWAAESRPRETIRDCSDFQALIPAYRSGSLPPARALLFEDHTRTCLTCRKALRAVRAEDATVSPPVTDAQTPSRSRTRAWAWGIAALVLIGIGLTQGNFLKSLLWSPGEIRATARHVEGTVFRFSGQVTQPMAEGDQIGVREGIRTARNSRALLQLADGSQIEIKERSEVSLAAGRDGATLQLERGSLIVSAAKQRAGHLYVATPDCRVSVTGTVFSVNRGTKGSRVAVLEGEVWVEQGKNKKALHPGEQYATHASLGAIPIAEEIAWSKNVDAHIALLHAFSNLNKEWRERTSGPSLRYTSHLLNLVPEEAVLYAAFPNISATLGEAYDIFRRQISESPALRRWWDETAAASGGKPGLEEMIAKIRTFGEFLGDEIVLAVPNGKADECNEPLLLAEVRRPGDLWGFLRAEVARLNAAASGPMLRIMDNPVELASLPQTSAHGREMMVLLNNNILAVSPAAGPLQRVAALQQNPGSSPFRQTGFYSRIAGAYSNGVGWLVAADLESLFAEEEQKDAERPRGDADRAFLRQTGLSDVKQLMVEQKSVGGMTKNQATLSFKEARRGMAGWLADPGPMGALEFISPDASGLAAFVIKEPGLIVDELFSLMQTSDAKAWPELLDFQAQHGIDIRADIAAPLGSEFLVALDGPILPTPSWKLIVEVYDPARLQKTLEWAVAELNRVAMETGKPAPSLIAENADGRTFYRLLFPETGIEAHYVFWDGYLLAAPSRALLIQSMQYRTTGYTLPKSAAFRAALPVDGRAHCSALLYQNVHSVVGPLAKYLPASGAGLNSEQLKSLQAVAAQTPPTLVVVYGERDQIVLASRSALVSNLGTLAGFGGLWGMMPGPPRRMERVK